AQLPRDAVEPHPLKRFEHATRLRFLSHQLRFAFIGKEYIRQLERGDRARVGVPYEMPANIHRQSAPLGCDRLERRLHARKIHRMRQMDMARLSGYIGRHKLLDEPRQLAIRSVVGEECPIRSRGNAHRECGWLSSGSSDCSCAYS